MADTAPTLGQVLERAIRTQLAQVRVGLPARVESYDATKCMVSVQPLILEPYEGEDGSRQVERLPVIVDVPVIFPGSGGIRIEWPISVGDTVFLTFASSSLDRWLVRGGEVDPDDDRLHDLSDAVAIPGLMDFAHVSRAEPRITFVGSEIQAGGAEALATKADLEALKAKFNAWTPLANDGGAALKTLLDALIEGGWPSGTSVLKGS